MIEKIKQIEVDHCLSFNEPYSKWHHNGLNLQNLIENMNCDWSGFITIYRNVIVFFDSDFDARVLMAIEEIAKIKNYNGISLLRNLAAIHERKADLRVVWFNDDFDYDFNAQMILDVGNDVFTVRESIFVESSNNK